MAARETYSLYVERADEGPSRWALIIALASRDRGEGVAGIGDADVCLGQPELASHDVRALNNATHL